MERLTPARRQLTLQFKMPPVKTIADVATASESVVSGVAHGRLTPAEGQAISHMLDGRRRMIETEELELRIRALEDRHPEESKR
jgi:hypothetical protein